MSAVEHLNLSLKKIPAKLPDSLSADVFSLFSSSATYFGMKIDFDPL
jgi:LytS/YehU family sensor histidine kinase